MFRYKKRNKFIAPVFVCALAFGTFYISDAYLVGAHAQQSTATDQSTNTSQQSAIDIESIFLQLVTAYPNGGNEFMSAISAMVVASPQSASQLISIVNQAAQSQGQANNQSPIKEVHIADVGRALAQSVAKINEVDPQAASEITALIAQSNNQPLQTAFVTSSGDATASTDQNNTGDNADQPGATDDNADQPGATGGGGTTGNILSGNNSGGGGGTISPSS